MNSEPMIRTGAFPLPALSSPKDEQAVIGCLILEAPVAFPVIKKNHLNGSWFDDFRNKVWFEKMADLAERNIIITPDSAAGQFNGDLQKYGGLAYYQELLAAAPSGYAVSDFVPRLKDLRARRLMVRAARRVEEMASDLNLRPGDLLPDFKRSIEGLLPDEFGSLPAITNACDLDIEEIPLPREIIKGLLHQGTKFALGGGSKTCKTWVLFDCAISVAAGVPWLGRDTHPAKVLFVNLEIHPGFFRRRLQKICHQKEIPIPENLDIWNLRGYEASSLSLLPKISERIAERGYALIILDPIYKTYGDLKENAAEDMSKLLNQFERVAVQSNAAIGFAAHFSKGNQAQKETIDRISGSGVFARDPDTIMTMTALEKEGTFVFEASLRNLKPFKPFGIKWHYPIMVRDDDIDPTKLKKPGGKPKGYEESKVGALLTKAPLTTAEWQKMAYTEQGVSRSSFYRCIKDLEASKTISKTVTDGKWMLSPIPADSSPTDLE